MVEIPHWGKKTCQSLRPTDAETICLKANGYNLPGGIRMLFEVAVKIEVERDAVTWRYDFILRGTILPHQHTEQGVAASLHLDWSLPRFCLSYNGSESRRHVFDIMLVCIAFFIMHSFTSILFECISKKTSITSLFSTKHNFWTLSYVF